METTISLFGGVGAAANAIGVAQPVVSHWRKRGVPAERVLAIAGATTWKVRPHDLRPDIYPNPSDGLPPEFAEQKRETA